MTIRLSLAVALFSLLALAACGAGTGDAPSATPVEIATPQATLTPPPPSEPHGLFPDYVLAFNLEWGRWTVLNLDGEIVAVWDCPDCLESDN